MFRVSGNAHCRLPNSVFKNVKSLRELYLGSLELDVLDTALYTGLDTLTHLDLSDNNIQQVPAAVADPTFLRSLKNLDLSFNQLRTLSNDTGQLLGRVQKVGNTLYSILGMSINQGPTTTHTGVWDSPNVCAPPSTP